MTDPTLTRQPASVLAGLDLLPPCDLRYGKQRVALGVRSYLAFRTLLAYRGDVSRARLKHVVWRATPVTEASLYTLAHRMNAVLARLGHPARVGWDGGRLVAV